MGCCRARRYLVQVGEIESCSGHILGLEWGHKRTSKNSNILFWFVGLFNRNHTEATLNSKMSLDQCQCFFGTRFNSAFEGFRITVGFTNVKHTRVCKCVSERKKNTHLIVPDVFSCLGATGTPFSTTFVISNTASVIEMVMDKAASARYIPGHFLLPKPKQTSRGSRWGSDVVKRSGEKVKGSGQIVSSCNMFLFFITRVTRWFEIKIEHGFWLIDVHVPEVTQDDGVLGNKVARDETVLDRAVGYTCWSDTVPS